MTEQQEQPDLRAAEARGHQTADTSARGAFLTAFLFLLCLGLIMAGVKLLYDNYRSAWSGAPRSGSAQEIENSPVRAWVAAQDELNDLRKREEKNLTQYGWADSSAGVARIPIDQAMEVLVEQEGWGTVQSSSGSGRNQPSESQPAEQKQ